MGVSPFEGCVDVVDEIVNPGVVHVGVGPRRPGVLLRVLLHVGEVAGVVDGDARDLARAPGEAAVGLELLALLVLPRVLGPDGPPGDDLLVDDEAVFLPRRVGCELSRVSQQKKASNKPL